MVVPPSTVIKDKISIPDEVNDGATLPGHLTAASQVVVFAPPFVIRSVIVPAEPDVGSPVKLNSQSPPTRTV